MKNLLFAPQKYAATAVISLLLVGGLAPNLQANANNSGSKNNRTTTSTTSGDAAQVRVTRASNYLGADVLASDARKVGDIVDFVFDTRSTPHLAYVLVMTGGFLDLGGDVRAIPASAISTTGDQARVTITSQQYWDTPVLPDDRQRYLSDPNNAQRLAQSFNVSHNQNPSLTPTGRQNTAGNNQSSRGATAQSGNSSGQNRLVIFSELRNAAAYSTEGQRLGYLADAWISLDRNRAPYVEITPTYNPFRTPLDRRIAIPMARFQRESENVGYDFATSVEDLTEAKAISETEGVKMLESGEFQDAVLRVTVAQR